MHETHRISGQNIGSVPLRPPQAAMPGGHLISCTFSSSYPLGLEFLGERLSLISSRFQPNYHSLHASKGIVMRCEGTRASGSLISGRTGGKCSDFVGDTEKSPPVSFPCQASRNHAAQPSTCLHRSDELGLPEEVKQALGPAGQQGVFVASIIPHGQAHQQNVLRVFDKAGFLNVFAQVLPVATYVCASGLLSPLARSRPSWPVLGAAPPKGSPLR
jgi:hypothetical protein